VSFADARPARCGRAGASRHLPDDPEQTRTILETNGRRWHDDPADYEHDNEKWSVPGRHGYRIVFATWEKVTQNADALLHELEATLAPFR
jgi:hypothetical protein